MTTLSTKQAKATIALSPVKYPVASRLRIHIVSRKVPSEKPARTVACTVSLRNPQNL